MVKKAIISLLVLLTLMYVIVTLGVMNCNAYAASWGNRQMFNGLKTVAAHGLELYQRIYEREKRISSHIGFLSGRADENGYMIQWRSCEQADGFIIEVASGNNKQEIFVHNNTNHYTIHGVKQGESSTIYVKAFINENGKPFVFSQTQSIVLTVKRTKECLDIQNIYQYSGIPLPTGCECTSLSIALKYYGYDITKNDISKKYLNKQERYVLNGVNMGPDPQKAFVGTPEDGSSLGCYSKPIAEAANRYFNDERSNSKAKAVDGKRLETLFDHINNKQPVIIWATADMKPMVLTDKWKTADGKTIVWRSNEHCLVLAGYDYKRSEVYCCDPLKSTNGLTTYNLDIFQRRYIEQGKHAVIIE